MPNAFERDVEVALYFLKTNLFEAHVMHKNSIQFITNKNDQKRKGVHWSRTWSVQVFWPVTKVFYLVLNVKTQCKEEVENQLPNVNELQKYAVTYI